MKLSKEELIKKFKILEKFKDQKWIEDEAIKSDCNYKEIPLKCALELIKDIIHYLEKNKFNSNWESYFGVKKRLEQVKDLLFYFCEDSIKEKTIKGTNINPQDPIR